MLGCFLTVRFATFMCTWVLTGGRPVWGNHELAGIVATAPVERLLLLILSEVTMVHYPMDLSLLILGDYGKEFNVFTV